MSTYKPSVGESGSAGIGEGARDQCVDHLPGGASSGLEVAPGEVQLVRLKATSDRPSGLIVAPSPAS